VDRQTERWNAPNVVVPVVEQFFLLPDRTLVRPLFSAAWVVEACRVDVSARGVDSASTRLADGADGILGTVGAAVGEGQRLLKADHVELGIARTRKRLSLDQVSIR